MEKNAKNMVASAEKLAGNKAITKNYARLKSLADSPEAKRLASNLSEEDISALGKDGDAAARKIKQLLSGAEGKALVRKVAEITGTGKD